MESNKYIDIYSDIKFIHELGVLEKLLKDQTTNKNIVWSTDAYEDFGPEFNKESEILLMQILGTNFFINRASKNKITQLERTKSHAEVFSSSSLCKKMTENFDQLLESNFYLNNDQISLISQKSWQRYIELKVLEICCGEAPFLVNRYDSVTGKKINFNNRIGLLDKKIKIINENVLLEKEWFDWIIVAFQSTYGYELQGDSLLISRINLLQTFIESVNRRWNRNPSKKELELIIEIITWNIWQMDGLTYQSPYKSKDDFLEQISIFSINKDFHSNNKNELNESKIFDWTTNKENKFKNIEKSKAMEFDFIIGNPPFDEEIENNGRKRPIYDKFMKESFKIGKVVELITPARFLFDAGQTPSSWNKKMLNDRHFKILDYWSKASEVFPNVEIKGGVAITLRNRDENYSPIKTFLPFKEQKSLINKINQIENNNPRLDSIISSSGLYKFTQNTFNFLTNEKKITKSGTGRKITSKIFSQLTDIFKDLDDGNSYSILGRKNNTRIYKFVNKEHIETNEFISHYNLLVPKANNKGDYGETLSDFEVSYPGEITTDTFLSFGCFSSDSEVKNLEKYLKTKFTRSILGIKKVTQDNPASVWSLIPLQNFSKSSEIDWTKSISEIDQQLYKKYNLSPEEIKFIEENVKEMK